MDNPGDWRGPDIDNFPVIRITENLDILYRDFRTLFCKEKVEGKSAQKYQNGKEFSLLKFWKDFSYCDDFHYICVVLFKCFLSHWFAKEREQTNIKNISRGNAFMICLQNIIYAYMHIAIIHLCIY